jgi:LuxR family maltose regulon positive regulatory protein
MSLTGLAGQVRIHAIRGRTQTAFELLAQLEAMSPVFEQPPYRAMQHHSRRTLALARAYACLAASDLDGAAGALRIAADAPPSARRGPPALAVRALQALVAHEQGRPESRDMLAEVVSLADLAGMRSYVEWAHPLIAGMLAPAGAAASSQAADSTQAGATRRARPPVPASGAAAYPPVEHAAAHPTSGLLTPREARILSLLAVGRANKEIARAMDIGEQTVKWHLKNVFFKLNAAGRKHAVDRARLLGLLPG